MARTLMDVLRMQTKNESGGSTIQSSGIYILSSDSSEEEEIGRRQTQPILVEGAVPHDENVTVDEILEGSFEDEDGNREADWWKAPMTCSEKKSDRDKKGTEVVMEEPGLNYRTDAPARSSDLVIHKIIRVMDRRRKGRGN
jgi:hypothetical protein